jgi:glycosyltransferase involved in cell wall biosynthesis
MPPSNLLIVAGSETYAFDMGLMASRFTNVALVRWTPPGQFEGSLFEMYTIQKGQSKRVTRVWVPLRTRRKSLWYASRLPLFIINTWIMFSLAVRARKNLGAGKATVSGLGIGWGGAIIALFLKKLRLLETFAYYRVDWFVGRPQSFYDFFAVNVFFRLLDRTLSRASGCVWNMTEAVKEAAILAHHFRNPKEMIVKPPIGNGGVHPNTPRIGEPYIVYCGEVKPGCGLPLVLGALRALRTQNQIMNLKVIGRARTDYLASLHQEFSDVFDSGLCQYLGGFDAGNEGDKQLVNQIIAGADAGVAIFPSGSGNTSNYVIPNRILLYLANHTPVLINEDSAAADWLCSAGVALATSPLTESIAKGVLLLRDSSEVKTWLRSNIGPFMATMASGSEAERALGELTGNLS